MGKLRVRIDESKCIAAGQCVFAAPAVFDQREEDGIVVLLNETPDESQAAAVRKAARLCPSLAIIVEDA